MQYQTKCPLHPAGVCRVSTAPFAVTGASIATCAPTTPAAVPSRRAESTPPRYGAFTHHMRCSPTWSPSVAQPHDKLSVSLQSSSSAEGKSKAAATRRPAGKQKYQISSSFIDIETKAAASLNHSRGFILDPNQLEASRSGTAPLGVIITRAQSRSQYDPNNI